jgi:radical SAM superfamily enzyme YgiQ (UPF0313 family)
MTPGGEVRQGMRVMRPLPDKVWIWRQPFCAEKKAKGRGAVKILLVAVGSKYIHSNLAVYSLNAYARAAGVKSRLEVAEYTVNQRREDILADLYGRKPDVAAFSCYIWNISLIKSLAADLTKLRPELEIWLGGPEASHDAGNLLREQLWLRGVMAGEGEETFRQLAEYYEDQEGRRLGDIPGIYWRDGEDIRSSGPGPCLDLSRVSFAYGESVPAHRILYYESSRGCPFSCGYCLSSVDRQLRFRDPALVEKELSFFLERRAPQVKFTDRTFNCSHSHAMHIWKYLEAHDNGVTNFHFEVSADLLNEEELELLGRLRPGYVQLEAGIQSVNPDTLQAVGRRMDLERLAKNIRRLNAGKNIHLHLDLIAGLPLESYDSFRRSFDWAYELRPGQLQLGFLKVLKGSPLREKAQEYGLVFCGEPPYEILQTADISYEELCRLKRVEQVLEIYYNSSQFGHTMERLVSFYPSPFALYEELADYFLDKGLFDRQLGRAERFDALWDFIVRKGEKESKETHSGFLGVAWQEILVYDYYLRENAKTRPRFAPDQKKYWPSITGWYARHAAARPELAAYRGYGYRQLLHMTHAEVISRDFSQIGQKILIVFDYGEKNPLTGNAAAWEGEEWMKENG